MNGGYKKTAELLLDLNASDRDWLLGELPVDDRLKVVAILRELVEEPPAGGKGAGSGKLEAAVPGASSQGPKQSADSDMETLANADPSAIEAMLAGEPDWIEGLLLSHTVWPWAAAYLDRYTGEELDRLKAVVQKLDAAVKPLARAAAVEACARRLRELAPPPMRQSAFDTVLAAMRNEGQARTERAL